MSEHVVVAFAALTALKLRQLCFFNIVWGLVPRHVVFRVIPSPEADAVACPPSRLYASKWHMIRECRIVSPSNYLLGSSLRVWIGN